MNRIPVVAPEQRDIYTAPTTEVNVQAKKAAPLYGKRKIAAAAETVAANAKAKK